MTLRIEGAKAFMATSFGYEFKNNALLMEALDTTGLRKRESNQRLALLGDKLLTFLIADAWFATGAAKVTAQNNITRIGSNVNLAAIAQDIGLDEHVMINPGQVKPSRNLLATAIEAVFGAIYLDSDKDIDTIRFAMCRMDMDIVVDGPF